MLFLNKQRILLPLLMVLLISVNVGAADKAKKTKTAKADTENSSKMTAKSLDIKQSEDEKVKLKTEYGFEISLPKIEKIVTETKIPLIQPHALLPFDSLNTSMLRKKIEVMAELDSLSNVLGIEIRDASHIDLYREVVSWLGTKYRRGGMSRSRVDCSGFTNLIYNNVFDKKLPRVSTEIARQITTTLGKDELEPGDLVFFSTFGKKYINHVGVYIGEGNFVHASIKKGVVVSTLLEGYYSRAWRKGGRME